MGDTGGRRRLAGHYAFRQLSSSDLPSFRTLWLAAGLAFWDDGLENWFGSMDWTRSIGGFFSGEAETEVLVAGLLFQSKQMILPGGGEVTVPALAWAATHPEHRRSGLITEMLRSVLLICRQDFGEIVATSMPVKPGIWTQLGFGLATRSMVGTIGPGMIRRSQTAGEYYTRVSAFDGASRYNELRSFRPRATRRVGALSVSEEELLYCWRNDQSGRFASKLVVTAYSRDSVASGRSVAGYCVLGVEIAGSERRYQVIELVSSAPGVWRTLWRELLRLSKGAKVHTGPLALDDPLIVSIRHQAVADLRVYDGVHMRILDVPGALLKRGYLGFADAVLDVRDSFLPEVSGRWHLRADRDGATCRVSALPADVCLDVVALARVYLGDCSWRALREADQLVELQEGACKRLDEAFTLGDIPHHGLNF